MSQSRVLRTDKQIASRAANESSAGFAIGKGVYIASYVVANGQGNRFRRRRQARIASDNGTTKRKLPLSGYAADPPAIVDSSVGAAVVDDSRSMLGRNRTGRPCCRRQWCVGQPDGTGSASMVALLSATVLQESGTFALGRRNRTGLHASGFDGSVLGSAVMPNHRGWSPAGRPLHLGPRAGQQTHRNLAIGDGGCGQSISRWPVRARFGASCAWSLGPVVGLPVGPAVGVRLV